MGRGEREQSALQKNSGMREVTRWKEGRRWSWMLGLRVSERVPLPPCPAPRASFLVCGGLVPLCRLHLHRPGSSFPALMPEHLHQLCVHLLLDPILHPLCHSQVPFSSAWSVTNSASWAAPSATYIITCKCLGPLPFLWWSSQLDPGSPV